MRIRTCLAPLLALLLVIGCATSGPSDPNPDALTLHTRHRVASAGPDGGFRLVEQTVSWEPSKTAIIIVDMWDDHWCRGAAGRVAELAGPMNEVVEAARQRGVLIIHSPSTTVAPYEGTSARLRAQDAAFAASPVPLATEQRWGTAWCWPDPSREPDMPIDDSDMGCDCEQKCEIREAWSSQIATLRIDDADAVSDDGQEVYNLLESRGIDNVMLMGVHLNMCVLGRPFGIRQMVSVDKNVVLVRDLTDTMYNSQMAPRVDHFTGTDLVVEHIERHWCPTITSVDLGSETPFRFPADRR